MLPKLRAPSLPNKEHRYIIQMSKYLSQYGSFFSSDIFITSLVIIVLLILQYFSLHYISNKKWSSETLQLKVGTYVRNTFLTFIIVSIIAIWIPQIQSFAISIAAIAVAVVVSLKEIIMLFTGMFMRTSADLFSVGDRIKINNFEGDVIRAGFLTTDLLEITTCGQRTGRVIHVPNSYFLTYPLINEFLIKEFTLHIITLPFSVDKYSEELKQDLKEFVRTLLVEQQISSRENHRKFVRLSKINRVSPELRILMHIQSYRECQFVIRLPVIIQDKVKIEQKISEYFMARLFQK